MKMLFRALVIFFLFPLAFHSQITGDIPCNPILLGPLPLPDPCPSVGFGDSLAVTASTLGASVEPASAALQTCSAGGNINALSPDLWFKFKASASKLSIRITGAGGTIMTQPGVSLFMDNNGMCMNLIPIFCAVGSGTQLTAIANSLVPGVDYYLQVRGCATALDKGNFLLQLQNANDCAACAGNSFLNPNPSPVNGYYPPTKPVTFTYALQGYKSFGGNFMKAVIPTFSSAWDTLGISSTALAGPPASGAGVWKWTTNNGAPGFYYDQNGDGIFNNDMGDSGTVSSIWTFQFIVRAKACPASNKNLQVDIEQQSDGEFYNNGFACALDAGFHFKSVINCCELANPGINNTSCLGQCNGGITLTGTNSSAAYPLGVVITDPYYNGVATGQINSLTQSYNASFFCQGVYNTVVFDTVSACFDVQNITVAGPIVYDIAQTVSTCGSACGNAAQLIFPAAPPTNYSFTWVGPGSYFANGAFATNMCPGTYTVLMSSGTCPTHYDSVQVFGLPPDDPTVVYPFQICNQPGVVTPYVENPGGYFNYLGGSGMTFNANTGEIYFSGSTFNGNNVLTYTTPGPCPVTDTFSIQIVSTYDASFTFSAAGDFCKETLDTVFVNAALPGIGTYNWTPLTGGNLAMDYSNGNLFIDISTAGKYKVQHDINMGTSCDVSYVDSILIVDTCSFAIPSGDVDVKFNAISPNSDGYNDFWYISGIEGKENRVTIFNRYGTLVFEQNDYNNMDKVWTGSAKNGKRLPSATYYYVVRISSEDKILKGWIELLE
jgi:gliding motility-associated-like protein